jgi:hypothetical protein
MSQEDFTLEPIHTNEAKNPISLEDFKKPMITLPEDGWSLKYVVVKFQDEYIFLSSEDTDHIDLFRRFLSKLLVKAGYLEEETISYREIRDAFEAYPGLTTGIWGFDEGCEFLGEKAVVDGGGRIFNKKGVYVIKGESYKYGIESSRDKTIKILKKLHPELQFSR